MPKPARVLGPYRNGAKWRLVVLDGHDRKSLVAKTHAAALVLRDELLGALARRAVPSVGEALAAYLQELRERGVSAGTTVKVERMLRPFLPLAEPLAAVDAERAQALYLAETRRKKASGAPLANDSHHLLLRRVKHFYRWAVARGHLAHSPFAEVRPLGRPRRGKPQLRIDEARKLVAAALTEANALDVGAAAVLLQIFLGLRPTEALARTVRDLDDDGRVLWIPFGKTHSARRRLQVPDALRGILLRHAAGKPGAAPLLGPPGEPLHGRDLLRHRLQKLCDRLGLPRVCPHSLRGLNATLALEAGATAHHVAAALGHASFTTTARHYADPSSVANAGLRRVAELLARKSEPARDAACGPAPDPEDRPEISELAARLRAQLSASDLALLLRKLSSPE